MCKMVINPKIDSFRQVGKEKIFWATRICLILDRKMNGEPYSLEEYGEDVVESISGQLLNFISVRWSETQVGRRLITIFEVEVFLPSIEEKEKVKIMVCLRPNAENNREEMEFSKEGNHPFRVFEWSGGRDEQKIASAIVLAVEEVFRGLLRQQKDRCQELKKTSDELGRNVMF